jgi:drug/metabolite transporter (DMT)-like permease
MGAPCVLASRRVPRAIHRDHFQVRHLVDAVLLALVSAALFGAMPVAVRFALVPPLVPAAVGALLMQVGTFAVLCVAAAIQGGITLEGVAPFLIAGAIAPGLSNLFITVGIREAGSSRASVAFGMAPLFAVTIAVLVFDERPGTTVLFGALLIVSGRVTCAGSGSPPRSSVPPSSRCATTSSATSRSRPTSRR